MSIQIAITADRGIPKEKLDKLSQQTSLPLMQSGFQADYLLHIKTEHLVLQKVEPSSSKKAKKPLSIYIDFVEGKAQHRRIHGGGKGQDIAKAVGLNKIKNPSVLDLTAGMGGDAFVLASLGCEMTLVERNHIIHALLDDALARANLINEPELQEILARMTLLKKDSLAVLEDLTTASTAELPDVIYIDPMFPSREKSAKVKKEMQFFHDVVGADQDSEALLLKALQCAKKRIVVKRPRISDELSDKANPAFVIAGKSTRYDVYLPTQA